MPAAGNTPRARALGAELRELRNAAGFGVRELARHLGISRSSLSRYESGQSVPEVRIVAMILGALGVTTADRDRILDLAEDAKDATWLETSIPGVHRQLLALIEFERTARLITEVSPLLIPGLLQTGDYARAIMTGAGHRGHEAESRVMVRLGRKEILVRRKPVELVALIGEQAIRQPLGGPDVMAEQLHHLSEMAQRPNITIQVIPATGSIWHPGLTGPFTLLEFPLAPPMVNLEHHRSSLFLFESDDVSVYKDVVGTVRSIAMSPEESAKLIIDSKDKMEKA